MCARRPYVYLHKLPVYNQQQSGGKLEVECLLAVHAHTHTHTDKLVFCCVCVFAMLVGHIVSMQLMFFVMET